MLLAQRSYVLVPCPVRQRLRPMAELTRDTGQGSQFKAWYQQGSNTRDKHIAITRAK